MYKKTFIDACLDAEATLFDLDDYVEYWHTHETGNSLREFLGMTPYEYWQWGITSDAIIRDILSCRRNGIPFEQYKTLSENERIAARSYDADAIEKMKAEWDND